MKMSLGSSTVLMDPWCHITLIRKAREKDFGGLGDVMLQMHDTRITWLLLPLRHGCGKGQLTASHVH